MMRLLRRLPALSALALLLALLSSVLVVAPASAASNAYNITTSPLTSTPRTGGATLCVHREIYLAKGRYNWGEVLDAHFNYRKTVDLGAGNYRWTDCLVPGAGVYRHTSWLDPANPNWNYIRYDNYGFGVVKSGDRVWGSYLDPHF